MRKYVASLALALLMTAGSAGGSFAQDRAVKIGILNDQSGPYADPSGKGSALMAELAIADFGGTLFGKPIEMISADHQNSVDIGSSLARRWLDTEKVDAIFDVPNSGVALAIQEVVRERGGLFFASGGGTSTLTGKACSPYGFQWTYDTFALANGAGRALAAQGLKSWYLLQVDYAFGAAAAADLDKVLKEVGGKIVGSVKTPLNTKDFSSFLLQAQSSGAQVVALLNAGADTLNSLKQANEFGLPQAGQHVVGLIFFETDARGLGLEAAQGLTVVLPFYWKQNPDAEAVSQRFFKKTGKMPSYIQIGVYSSVLHYLKAVKEAGSLDRTAISAKVHALPVEDAFVKAGKVREDGRMLHEMYLATVRSPQEAAKGNEWDVFDVKSVIAGKDAARPLPVGECPMIKQ